MEMDPSGLNSGISKKINGKAQQEVAVAIDSISKWRTFLAVHPAADRIPEASEDEKRELITDLARQGQRQPIILVRVATRPTAPPQLLDGRTRLDLLSAAGIDVIDDANGKILVQHRVVQVADDAEAERLSLSLNVHRRHLTAEQKHELIVQQLKAAPEKSNRQIAETVKASPTFVGKVRAEKEATGDVSTVDTRTDTKGRKQPAKKAKKAKQPAKSEPVESAAPASRGDVGADSANEIKRLLARNEELENKNRQLEIKSKGLESEVEELRAENKELRAKLEVAQKGAAASPKIAAIDIVTAGDPGPIPEFLQRKPEI
jgi:hypothetical protein